MKYKLAATARLKHDKSTNSYYLFCIETGNHVRLNDTSYQILTLLEKGLSSDEMETYICREYDVAQDEIKKDVLDFFEFLAKNNFIII
mgnify:CR=1 FL=1